MKVIKFNSQIYKLQAIKNAAYDFSGKATVQIDVGSNRIFVEITPKPGFESGIKELISEFINIVLDHQIRIDTYKDYKIIRQMIIAQAFAPCDNLEELVKALNP